MVTRAELEETRCPLDVQADAVPEVQDKDPAPDRYASPGPGSLQARLRLNTGLVPPQPQWLWDMGHFKGS